MLTALVCLKVSVIYCCFLPHSDHRDNPQFQDELVSLCVCPRISVTYTKQLSGDMLQACLVAFAMYLTRVSATVVASLEPNVL